MSILNLLYILIRFRNDDGNQVFLDLKGSLFDFGYNKKNFVTIRFDKDEPVKYVVRPLDNGSDQSVALSKPIDFIKRAKSATTILIETPISKASCQQRKGRAGRTAPGSCYRLYPRRDFETRQEYTTEEIFRTDLSEVVLRMAELGI